MSSKKRLAAEAAKKPKPLFPTSLRPDYGADTGPNSRTMTISESGVLKATLMQSRQTWLQSAFQRFVPEPGLRGAGGKKFASEVTPIGVCAVCLGPHIFQETTFFAIYTPPPPPFPQPHPMTGSATNNGIVQGASVSTVTATAASSPCATISSPASSPALSIAGTSSSLSVSASEMSSLQISPPSTASSSVIPDGSSSKPVLPTAPLKPALAPLLGMPAPQRVIELLIAQTRATRPVSGDSICMDIEIDPLHPQNALKDQLAAVAAKAAEVAAMGPINAQILSSTVGAGSTLNKKATAAVGTGAGSLSTSSRQSRPLHQVAFEFKESSGSRWLFPHETSLEWIPADEQEPAKIACSFFLPAADETRMGTTMNPGQSTTMVIVNANTALWERLLMSVNDQASTYRHMSEKLKHLPPRTFVQHRLPVTYSNELLEPIGLHLLPDHRVTSIESLQPSKRKPEPGPEVAISEKAKGKRIKIGQEDPETGITKLSKKATAAAAAAAAAAVSAVSVMTAASASVQSVCMSSATAGSIPATSTIKKCQYCGCTSTPMWRRGPEGSGTLCNACGVKWKHGKILQAGPTKGGKKAVLPLITPLSPTTDKGAMGLLDPLVPTPSSMVAVAGVADGSSSALSSTLTISPSSALGNTRPPGLHQTTTAAAVQMLKTTWEEGDPLSGQDTQKAVIPTGKSRATHTQAGRSRGTSSTSSDAPLTLVTTGSKQRTDGERIIPVKKRISSKAAATGTVGALADRSELGSAGETAKVRRTSAKTEAPTAVNAAKVTKSAKSTEEGPSPLSITIASAAVSKGPATLTPTGKKTASLSSAKLAKATAVSTAATASSRVAAAPKPNIPISAAAKLTLLKAISQPKYASTSVIGSTVHLADDGLSLYATKNLYTNNTATFPLHFPTISIAFGPNNAYYTYPNCAVVLFENHFQIKLIDSGVRTEIDVWKEGIEETEFQVVDVGDGESMIVLKALLRQHLTRFDKELLNPDRNETLLVFRFRERLDGGGPPVKPLLEQWLTTEIPVAPSSASGTLSSSSSSSAAVDAPPSNTNLRPEAGTTDNASFKVTLPAPSTSTPKPT